MTPRATRKWVGGKGITLSRKRTHAIVGIRRNPAREVAGGQENSGAAVVQRVQYFYRGILYAGVLFGLYYIPKCVNAGVPLGEVGYSLTWHAQVTMDVHTQNRRVKKASVEYSQHSSCKAKSSDVRQV